MGLYLSTAGRVRYASCQSVSVCPSMALIYTRSTAKTAKGYSRTDNMESNPGVATLAIINPGKRVDRNPYQWISGRGSKHKHASPSYKSMKGASGWGKSHTESKAKLYPVDERGTVLGRPISRRNQMAYNIGALRRRRRGRKMRRNSHAELFKAARAIDVGGGRSSKRRSSKRRSRRGRARSTVTAHTERVTMPGKRRRRRSSRKTSRKSSKRSTAARKAARTRAAKKLARSMAAKKAARTRRRRSGKKTSRRRRSSKRRSGRKTSRRRRSSKRRSKRASKRRRSSKRRSRKRRSRRGSKRRASKRRRSRRGSKRASKRRRSGRRRSRRRSGGYYYQGKKIGSPGVKGLESYFARGIAPQVTRVPRLFNRSRVTSYGYGAHLAKISRRGKTSRRRRTSRKTSRRRRSSKRTSMAANRRRRRRRSRGLSLNRNRSRRRTSRRRRSRRGRLRSNMLAQRRGRGKGRISGRGPLTQVVQLGPRSRRRGYPVTVAQHTLANAYVRRFKFGGIAKRKHLAKRSSMAANGRRRRSRRVSRNAYVLAPNRRRRRSRRISRNAYVLAPNRRRRRRRSRRMSVVPNRRRRRSMKSNRRRMRRNSVLGLSTSDLSSVLRPTIAGAAGFVGARIVGNAAMRIPFVARLGDWGGILTDLALAGVTLTFGSKIPMVGATIRQNQSALVVGMGLDAVDRLLKVVHVPILSDVMASALPGPAVLPPPTTTAPEATSGMGAYIDVSHAGAPYKGMLGVGEYVEQPMGDAGIFSANVFDEMNGG